MFEFVGVRMHNDEQLFLALPESHHDPEDFVSVSHYDGNSQKDMSISVHKVTLIQKCENRTGVYNRSIVYETPNYGQSWNTSCWEYRHGLVD